MSLDVAKLEKVRKLAGGIVQARCPACAEGGNDRAGEHLRIYPSGKFGCCVYPKDRDHRKRIWALAGVRQPGTFTLRLKTPTALPAVRSVKTALDTFTVRTLRTPVAESVSSEAKITPPASASNTPDSGQPDLLCNDIRTVRTGSLMSRAYRNETAPTNIYAPVYIYKDWECAVLNVLPDLAAETGLSPVLPDGHHERLPFLTAGGTLVIPFDSPERYHWGRGGQPVAKTLAEVRTTLATEKV